MFYKYLTKPRNLKDLLAMSKHKSQIISIAKFHELKVILLEFRRYFPNLVPVIIIYTQIPKNDSRERNLFQMNVIVEIKKTEMLEKNLYLLMKTLYYLDSGILDLVYIFQIITHMKKFK